MPQEAADRERIVVGQVGAQDALAKQVGAGLATGGRHVGEQQVVVRMAGKEPLHQRLGSPGLANRHRVQPNHRPAGVDAVAPEALADVFQVLGLAPRPPGQAQRNKR